MKKFLIGLIIFLTIIILVPLTILGIVPGLSSVFGAGQKDLGIKITENNAKESIKKMGSEVIILPKGTDIKNDYRLEGKKDIDISMSSEELSAHSYYPSWQNYPIKNRQIRINNDGTVEVSGILVVSKIMPYAVALGYSEDQIRSAMEKYKIPSFEVPIYTKGSGSVTNNKVTVNAQTIKIGAVSIPENIISQVNREAESFLGDLIQKNSNSVNYESLTFNNGKMQLKGQVPEKKYIIVE